MSSSSNYAPLSLVTVFLLAACSSEAPPVEDPGGNATGGSGLATGGTGSGGMGTGGGSIPDPTGGAPAATGGAGTGGEVAMGTGGGGGLPGGACSNAGTVDPAFQLLWEDQFDSFDNGRWEKMTHSFDINLAQFSPDAVVTEDGYLKLKLTRDQTGDREYRGGEVKSTQDFQYGRFDTCVRWGSGGGVVASFFTYVFGPWNEIDIEYLGGQKAIQYNLIWDNGADTPRQYKPHYDSGTEDLTSTTEFHHYAFEWTPNSVKFYIDGQLRHTEQGSEAAQLTRAASLRMNLWPTSDGFAGNFEPDAIPTESWYDWVRVYSYNP